MPKLEGYITQNPKNLKDLKEEKAALAAEGFPARKTGELVLKYWKGKIELPLNSVLYVAPSTTGTNLLPAMIALKIQRENPTAEIVNGYATAKHLTQSANKTAFEKMRDPVKWNLHKDLQPTGRPAFVVEDVVTTGQSLSVLRETLAERGIAIHGCISLQQAENYCMSQKDFTRFVEKLETHEKFPGIADDLRTMMAGQPRRRAGVLEAILGKATNEEKNEIANHIRSEAKRIRELDPRTHRILKEFGRGDYQVQQQRAGKTRDSGGR